MKFSLPNQDKIADAIENGAVLHLNDPSTGLPGYRGGNPNKPMRAKLRSYRSKFFQDHQFKQQALATAKAKVSRAKSTDELQREGVLVNRPNNFSALLISLENFTDEGGWVDVPADDAIAMANIPEWKPMVDQMMEFAFTDADFFKSIGAEVPPPLQKAAVEPS